MPTYVNTQKIGSGESLTNGQNILSFRRAGISSWSVALVRLPPELVLSVTFYGGTLSLSFSDRLVFLGLVDIPLMFKRKECFPFCFFEQQKLSENSRYFFSAKVKIFALKKIWQNFIFTKVFSKALAKIIKLSRKSYILFYF